MTGVWYLTLTISMLLKTNGFSRLNIILMARFKVIRFQQTLILDYFETFSYVIKSSTIKVILKFATTYGCDIQQIDISINFLNGHL